MLWAKHNPITGQHESRSVMRAEDGDVGRVRRHRKEGFDRLLLTE